MLTEVITILFAALPFTFRKRKLLDIFTDRAAAKLFAIWSVLFCFEYFYLGANSYIYMDDQGELVLPHYVFLQSAAAKGQYTHLFASGVDTRSSFLIGDEFFSVARALIAIFPLWLAIALHQLIVCVVGLAGTYLLLRKGADVRADISIAVALLFTVCHFRMVQVTYAVGISWSLIPLGIYLCILCANKPRYWIRVLGFSILNAALMVPYQGIWPLFAGQVAAFFLFRTFSWQAVAAICTAHILLLANWAESIFGMALISQYSIHIQNITSHGGYVPSDSLRAAFDVAVSFFKIPLVAVLVVFSLLSMAYFHDRRIGWYTSALLVPPLLFAGFMAFPWTAIGAPTIRNASAHYALMACIPISLVAVSMSAHSWHNRLVNSRLKKFSWVPVTAILCVSFGYLGYYKTISLRDHFNYLGQRMYAGIGNLADLPVRSGMPFRVVSIWDRKVVPRHNILGPFYGLPIFDAWINMESLRHRQYWHQINRSHRGNELDIDISRDTPTVEVSDHANLRLLGAANVRYIISPIPLTDRQLTLIDGPTQTPYRYSRKSFPLWEPKIALYRWYLERFWKPWQVYIYEIDTFVPRVYAVRNVIVVPKHSSHEDFHRLIAEHGPMRGIVVREVTDGYQTFDADASAGSLKVASYEPVTDGYDIAVIAPAGGIVAINAVYHPFFKAFANGAPVPIVPANGVQMAVLVPPSTTEITLRYMRPTLRHSLISAIGGLESALATRK